MNRELCNDLKAMNINPNIFNGNKLLLSLLNGYMFIFRPFADYISKELEDCDTVIDIGCGKNSPLRYVKNIKYSVGVDIHAPYLKESKAKKIHDEYILEDIQDLILKDNSFDAVVCLSVIEHLTKDEAYKLIHKMEKIARKKCIIYTCNGVWPQDPFDNNPHQEHISGWDVNEFRNKGYAVYGISGFKVLAKLLRNKRKNRYFQIISKILLIDISQKLAFYYPKLATDIFCIKSLIKK